jgi:uncharacterized membrane protein
MLRKILTNNLLPIILLLVLDLLWISFYMGKKYQNQIENIQGKSIRIKPTFVILSYFLMVLGLILFVLPNISKGNELKDSLKYGLVFGIIVYGVYNFTNAAVIDKWDSKVIIADILWGGLLYFIVSYITSKITNN